MNQRPSEFDSDFKKFLDEFRTAQKVDLASNLTRTKFSSDVAKDDEKREEQLDKMNKTLEKIQKSLSGSKSLSKDKDEQKGEITLKDELKSFVAGLKRFGSGVASIAEGAVGTAKNALTDPIQTARVGAKKAGRLAEKAVTGLESGIEDIFGTPKDFKPGDNQSAKEKIKESKPVSINPEADNIETPQEKIADATEENVGVTKELLDTTKSSLTQLIAIKEALTRPQKDDTQPKEKSTPQIVDESGAPLALPDINLGKSKTIKPTPNNVKPTMSKVEPKPSSKPSVGSRIGGALKGAGKAALGAARVLGPIGAVAGAAYGAYEGSSRAGEIFGVEEGKEATTGQKVAGAIGGITDPFGLGYGDSVAKGVHSVGEKIGGFFGFGKDKKEEEKPKGKITIDMGGGEIKVVNPDGSYETKGAYGVKKFDKDGKLLSETTPTLGGYSETKTASGETTRSLNATDSDGLGAKVSETKDALGNVVGKTASMDMGLAKVSSAETPGKKSMAAEVRTETGENVSLRDEMSTGSKNVQPIVSNSVSTNNNTTYASIKADPRPLHRGSALDRYNDRLATF